MKPLAVFGTGSDAGKTSVVMALCRIFADQGIKLAIMYIKTIVTRKFRDLLIW